MRETTYILVGGGSGGHIVPLIPVAEQLKTLDSTCRVVHIGHKGDPLNRITRESAVIDETIEVSAGKFRRYHGQSPLVRLLDFRTLFFNSRDFFRFLRGYWQSRRVLKRLKPHALFMNGGYVCASVGLAAGKLGFPYVTHDSDAMVSLAHKIIAKNARKHLTALPAENYGEYEQDKVVQVGVPIRSEFSPVEPEQKGAARKKLGLKAEDHVLLVTGGGLGSKQLNQATVEAAKELLANDVKIIHLTGAKLFQETQSLYVKQGAVLDEANIKVEAYSDDMVTLSAAADVIVTRAGMTAISEFAAQEKCCVVIPSPHLAGGHQLKNAAALKDAEAVQVIDERELSGQVLTQTLMKLFENNSLRRELAQNLHTSVNADAAVHVARILTELV